MATASTGLAATAALGFGCGGNGSPAKMQRLNKIGLQLYTVRNLMKVNVDKTLRDVAAIGYDEVEFAGYFGQSPQHIKSLLDETGLVAPSAHIELVALRGNVQSVIDDSLVVGHEYVVLPWLQHENMSIDDYKSLADECNEIGEAMKGAGIQFAYHNHEFEFTAIDGQVPMDILLDGTDPDLVKWEMDFFWVRHAGRDPFEYLERYPGRFEMCHVKDMDSSSSMVDVGAGEIDFVSLFSAPELAGLQHYFVERDHPTDAMASIRTSFDYLTSLSFERHSP